MTVGEPRHTVTAVRRRQLRRGRVMTSFTYRIISIALLTTAITAFLTLFVPNYPLIISSSLNIPLVNYPNSTVHENIQQTRRDDVLGEANSARLSSHQKVDNGNSTRSLNVSLSLPMVDNSKRSLNVSLSPPLMVDNSARSVVNVSVLPPPKMMAPRRRREPAYWRMSPNDALKYARKEIENVDPIIIDDQELYAPLFRNVSVFKRSYELMEKILKIYIYRGGKRPIFHTPELRGIYASEGWFMKLLEENRRFITPESEKAHLFYLPYSARQLQNALYVPDSHDLKPLSIYLRDYVNWIAGKYPFWNRTKGADHFLVACHDWGPYTTTAHEELCKNTIKALCNADTSEGIFKKGKDVSLPETTIRNPRRPLRYIGSGQRVSQRSILAFFAGNIHGRVRPVLLNYWDEDPDMKIYGPLPDRVSRKMNYIQHMKTSKYCICPMGFEVNSPRIVEAIYYECVPVIIADNFVLPFEEVLDWSTFSVVVAEKDIPNLKDILLGIPLRKYLKMHTCVKMLQKHFLWHPRPVKYDIFHMILHSIWFSRLNQIEIEE